MLDQLLKEIEILKKYFDLENEYFQLFYVPAAVLSKKIFKSPDNLLMNFFDKIDRLLEKLFRNTAFMLYYRMVLICGRAKK